MHGDPQPPRANRRFFRPNIAMQFIHFDHGHPGSGTQGVNGFPKRLDPGIDGYMATVEDAPNGPEPEPFEVQL